MSSFGLTDPVQTVSVLCRHPYDSDRKTVVVVGLAQGGTSLVAAVVDALGIPFSDTGKARGNFESTSRPGVPDDEATWFAKVAEITGRSHAWGFKDPNIYRFPAGRVHTALANPYYLVVTRDLMAICQRRRQGCDDAVLPSDVLRRAVRRQQEMWDWIFQLPPAPLLGISYQRAIAGPEAFVDGVIAFLGLTPTAEVRQRALGRISPTGGYWLTGEGADEWKQYLAAGLP